MFTTQHYNAVARILHDSRNAAMEYEQGSFAAEKTYAYWYDHVYTPFVKLFEEDNERFHTVSFCYAVATGEYVQHRVKEDKRDALREG